MISVDRAAYHAGVERWRLAIRGRIDALAGTVYVRPQLAAREGEGARGPSNDEVLSFLAAKHPALVKPGSDMHGPAKAAARARFNARRSDLFDIARAAGPAVCRAIAARLRSGRFVTNTPATTERKAREGLSLTPGVATEQLAKALDSARVTVER